MLWRAAIIDCLLRIFIGDIARKLYNRPGKAPLTNRAIGRDMNMARHGRTILVLPQRADICAQDFRQHRHDTVGEIGRIAAFARFLVEHTAGPHIKGHIRNRHNCAEATLPIRFCPNRIVMVARISRINRHNRDVAQILTSRLIKPKIGCKLRFFHRFSGKIYRNTVLGNRDQAEGFWRERIADHFNDFHPCPRAPATAFCQHQLASLRFANIGNG